MMVSITSQLSINRDSIASIERDHRFYMNGSQSTLVITMADGRVHRIDHGYGVDIYEIEKRIREGQP